MAWTTPRTWTSGEVVTQSELNAHLRDNMRLVGIIDIAQLGSLASNTTSVDFAPAQFNLPDIDSFRVVGRWRASSPSTGAHNLLMRLNNDSGTNYSWAYNTLSATTNGPVDGGDGQTSWIVGHGVGAATDLQMSSFDCYIGAVNGVAERHSYSSISCGYDGQVFIMSAAGRYYGSATYWPFQHITLFPDSGSMDIQASLYAYKNGS